MAVKKSKAKRSPSGPGDLAQKKKKRKKKEAAQAYRGVVHLRNGDWLPAGIFESNGVITATFDDSRACTEMGLEGMQVTNLAPSQIVKLDQQDTSDTSLDMLRITGRGRAASVPLSLEIIEANVALEQDHQYQIIKKENMLVLNFIFPETIASAYLRVWQSYAAYIFAFILIIDIARKSVEIKIKEKNTIICALGVFIHFTFFLFMLTSSVHILKRLFEKFELVYFQLVNLLYIIIRSYNVSQHYEDDREIFWRILDGIMQGLTCASLYLLDAVPLSVVSDNVRRILWPLVFVVSSFYFVLQLAVVRFDETLELFGYVLHTGDLQISLYTTMWLFVARLVYVSFMHPGYMILMTEEQMKKLMI